MKTRIERAGGEYGEPLEDSVVWRGDLPTVSMVSRGMRIVLNSAKEKLVFKMTLVAMEIDVDSGVAEQVIYVSSFSNERVLLG